MGKKLNKIWIGVIAIVSLFVCSINVYAACGQYSAEGYTDANVKKCRAAKDENGVSCDAKKIIGGGRTSLVCVSITDGSNSVYSQAAGAKYYTNYKKIGVTLSFYDHNTYTFDSVDIACQHKDGTYKYVGNVLNSKDIGQKSVFVSWDASNYKNGIWDCWSYNKGQGISSKTTFQVSINNEDIKDDNNQDEKSCDQFNGDSEDCLKNNCYWTGKKCSKTKTCDGGYVPSSSNSNKCVISSGGDRVDINYKVTLDSNYGSGLTCTNPYSNQDNSNPIVCSGTVKKGTKVNFPTNTIKNSEGLYLLGWTNKLANGIPNCHVSIMKKISDEDYSFNVSNNTTYYGCYKQDIGGKRFVMSNYIADGGAETYKCGQEIWIEYCIKDDTGDYCFFNENGTMRKIYRYRLANSSEGALATCNESSTDVTKDKGYRYVVTSGEKFACGDELYITTCNDISCKYTKVRKGGSSGTVTDLAEKEINRSYLKESLQDEDKKQCDKIDDDFEDLKKCSNEQIKSKETTGVYTNYCYKETDSLKDIYYDLSGINCDRNGICKVDKNEALYLCGEGTIIKENSIRILDGTRTCNKKGYCLNDIEVKCVTIEKPSLAVSSGIVGSNNKGTIEVRTRTKVGRVDAYFYSSTYKLPSVNDNWIPLTGDSFTITETPGTYYIWVRDNRGVVSNAVSGAVLDTVNLDTTIKNLEVLDAAGNLQVPVANTAYYTDTIKSSNYVMMSNNLSKDSNVVADGFNPFDMEYKLEVEGPTVTVYATLTSDDSNYVSGYEPRTVNLDYGVNTVLIKIQNKEGKVRTYTILVTRKDTRTSDNTLKDISLSVGNINFNSNVTDYKIEIPKNTSSIDVKSIIGSDKAKYVSGYEPGNVKITGDTTVKLIKVISETGSTRTYVLTFVKEGTDVISDKSLQISDLVISNVYIPFESSVANYSLSADYSVDTLNIYATKMDENSVVSVSVKNKNDNNYKVVSNVGIPLEVGENFIEIKVINSNNEESYYRLTIIRKEFGLEISDDTSLKDLKVLGYDKSLNFDPAKKEYTVKIKQEKTLVITAVPESNRAEVFIRGNEELTGFSTVRIKVVAENGEYETYSIDIKKDAFNKNIEIAAIIVGTVIILLSSGIIIMKKKNKSRREYFEE